MPLSSQAPITKPHRVSDHALFYGSSTTAPQPAHFGPMQHANGTLGVWSGPAGR